MDIVPITLIGLIANGDFIMNGDIHYFQHSFRQWCVSCFGETEANDIEQRRNRFLEEAIELHQAAGGTLDEVKVLGEYTYGRPKGSPYEETGGVMNTLCCLANALGLDVYRCARVELKRVNLNKMRIREKHKSKPRKGPLPGDYPD